jgi:hypothetical protein
VAPIKIGINLPLTGSKAQFGTMDWLSIQLEYADFDVTELRKRSNPIVLLRLLRGKASSNDKAGGQVSSVI